MTDRFKCKDGTPTMYAFACGHGIRDVHLNIQLTLFQDGNCYHVKAYDFSEHDRLVWESHPNLSAMKLYYRHLRTCLRKGKPLPSYPEWQYR